MGACHCLHGYRVCCHGVEKAIRRSLTASGADTVDVQMGYFDSEPAPADADAMKMPKGASKELNH